MMTFIYQLTNSKKSYSNEKSLILPLTRITLSDYNDMFNSLSLEYRNAKVSIGIVIEFMQKLAYNSLSHNGIITEHTSLSVISLIINSNNIKSSSLIKAAEKFGLIIFDKSTNQLQFKDPNVQAFMAALYLRDKLLEVDADIMKQISIHYDEDNYAPVIKFLSFFISNYQYSNSQAKAIVMKNFWRCITKGESDILRIHGEKYFSIIMEILANKDMEMFAPISTKKLIDTLIINDLDKWGPVLSQIQYASPKVIGILILNLNHQDLEKQLQAIKTLPLLSITDLNTRNNIANLLIKMTESEDFRIAEAAIQSLVHLVDCKNVKGFLNDLVYAQRSDIAIIAIEAIGEVKDSFIVDALLEKTKNDNIWIKYAAIEALGKLHYTKEQQIEVISSLIGMINEVKADNKLILNKILETLEQLDADFSTFINTLISNPKTINKSINILRSLHEMELLENEGYQHLKHITKVMLVNLKTYHDPIIKMQTISFLGNLFQKNTLKYQARTSSVFEKHTSKNEKEDVRISAIKALEQINHHKLETYKLSVINSILDSQEIDLSVDSRIEFMNLIIEMFPKFSPRTQSKAITFIMDSTQAIYDQDIILTAIKLLERIYETTLDSVKHEVVMCIVSDAVLNSQHENIQLITLQLFGEEQRAIPVDILLTILQNSNIDNVKTSALRAISGRYAMPSNEDNPLVSKILLEICRSLSPKVSHTAISIFMELFDREDLIEKLAETILGDVYRQNDNHANKEALTKHLAFLSVLINTHENIARSNNDIIEHLAHQYANNIGGITYRHKEKIDELFSHILYKALYSNSAIIGNKLLNLISIFDDKNNEIMNVIDALNNQNKLKAIHLLKHVFAENEALVLRLNDKYKLLTSQTEYKDFSNVQDILDQLSEFTSYIIDNGIDVKITKSMLTFGGSQIAIKNKRDQRNIDNLYLELKRKHRSEEDIEVVVPHIFSQDTSVYLNHDNAQLSIIHTVYQGFVIDYTVVIEKLNIFSELEIDIYLIKNGKVIHYSNTQPECGAILNENKPNHIYRVISFAIDKQCIERLASELIKSTTITELNNRALFGEENAQIKSFRKNIIALKNGNILEEESAEELELYGIVDSYSFSGFRLSLETSYTIVKSIIALKQIKSLSNLVKELSQVYLIARILKTEKINRDALLESLPNLFGKLTKFIEIPTLAIGLFKNLLELTAKTGVQNILDNVSILEIPDIVALLNNVEPQIESSLGAPPTVEQLRRDVNKILKLSQLDERTAYKVESSIISLTNESGTKILLTFMLAGCFKLNTKLELDEYLPRNLLIEQQYIMPPSAEASQIIIENSNIQPKLNLAPIGYSLMKAMETIPAIKYLLNQYIPLLPLVEETAIVTFLAKHEYYITRFLHLLGSGISIYAMPEQVPIIIMASFTYAAKPYIYELENKLLLSLELTENTWLNFAKFVTTEMAVALALAPVFVQHNSFTLGLIAGQGLLSGAIEYHNQKFPETSNSNTGIITSFTTTSLTFFVGIKIANKADSMFEKIWGISSAVEAAASVHYISKFIGDVIEDAALQSFYGSDSVQLSGEST